MIEELNTHNLMLTFGKHKGERWTRVPASYLRWLVNAEYKVEQHVQLAVAELARRGTDVSGQIELTPHAIDRASERLLKRWIREHKKNEGFYTWLMKFAEAAIRHCHAEPKPDRITYKGVIFVFRHGRYYPILKTVIHKKEVRPLDRECGIQAHELP